MMRDIRFPTLMVLLACFFSRCESKYNNWEGVITNVGEYHLSQNGYIINVINENKLLLYTVSNGAGKKVIESDDNASMIQKWSLYWDSQNNLWVKSSDIGDLVWKHDQSDNYKKYYFKNGDSLYEQMPQELKR